MEIKVLNENGLDSALLGLSLSYYDHAEPLGTWWTQEKFDKAMKRAKILAHNQGGHNKFIESLTVEIYIQAARSFWSEFDTYRVGMTKQSSSTMHTLDKRYVTTDDFETGTAQFMVDGFNLCLQDYKNPDHIHYKDITILKDNLPEGWLQERVVVTNYKTLQNIYWQREKHRLRYWRQFNEECLKQLQFPEFIKQNNKELS